jgi:putative holliday junction resolvase
MNLLAIDYGLKHIGLAIANHSPLAEPLPGFENKSPSHTIKTISRLIDQHHIDQMVIGHPHGKMRPIIENFILQLHSSISIPIELWEEAFTTRQAITQARQAGKSSVKIKAKEHSLAAAVILQDYLDNNQK